MIEEIHLFGVYLPAGLFWAMVALMITALVRKLLIRLPLQSILWQPGLLELAIYLLIWLGLTYLADGFLPHGFIS